MVAHRRWFHANPENSFEEVLTAAKVAQELIAMGIQPQDMWTEIGKTGVVAMIYGGAGEGPCIMLRADMDALPIQETSTVAYASKNANCMHACGHDGKCAMCPPNISQNACNSLPEKMLMYSRSWPAWRAHHTH